MCRYNKFLGLIVLALTGLPASAQDKPNILIIWGDDIGYFNVSAYNRGAMGYDTRTSTASLMQAYCSRIVMGRTAVQQEEPLS